VRRLQDKLLAETVALCYEGHPYYRDLMRKERLEPRHIQTCDDLVRLPVTSKADFLADPEAFLLRCPEPSRGGPAVGDAVLNKVVYTTGTTSGVPAPIFVASIDHFAYLFASRRRMEFLGIRES